jgi:hypothetical protein
MELLRSAPQVPALVLEIEGVEGEKVSDKMAEAYGKLEGKRDEAKEKALM